MKNLSTKFIVGLVIFGFGFTSGGYLGYWVGKMREKKKCSESMDRYYEIQSLNHKATDITPPKIAK